MIKNFREFFKEEKDIYIQNISNGQISLQFGKGDDTIPFKLIRKRDPIVLTNHVPFRMISESTDFRKILNRQPAVVKLLTEEEYNNHYKVKAKTDKISVDEAIATAETLRVTPKVEAPKSTAPKDDADTDDSDDKVVNEEDVVNPRAIHLCHQASEIIPAEDRMKPADLLAQLKELQDEFKIDDYEYILAHSTSKAIHTWAKSRQKLAAQQLAS